MMQVFWMLLLLTVMLFLVLQTANFPTDLAYATAGMHLLIPAVTLSTLTVKQALLRSFRTYLFSFLFFV
jgi:hypothetical protein